VLAAASGGDGYWGPGDPGPDRSGSDRHRGPNGARVCTRSLRSRDRRSRDGSNGTVVLMSGLKIGYDWVPVQALDAAFDEGGGDLDEAGARPTSAAPHARSNPADQHGEQVPPTGPRSAALHPPPLT
jgi:hypothetical protein